MKLTTKLALSIIGSSLVSLMVLGWAVFSLTSSQLQNSIQENKLGVMKQKMDKIDHLLYERHLDISTFARRPTIINAVLPGSTASQSGFFKVNYASLKMEFWDDIRLVNAKGLIVSSNNPALENTTVSEVNRPFFDQALAGQTVVSDIIFSPINNKETLVFASPIRNLENNQIVGVIMAHFAWQNVVELLEHLDHDAVVFNTGGKVVAKNFSQSLDQNDSDQLFAQIAKIKKEQMVNNGTFKFQDQIVIFVSQLGRLDYRGSNWTYAMRINPDEIFHPALISAIKVTLLLAAILNLSALLNIILSSKFFSDPLRKLTAAVRKISQGDWSTRVNFTSHDEIGELAQTFNSLIDQVKKSRDEIEAKVEEQTREITQQKNDLKKFQLAVKSSSEHMVITDAEGLIIYANPAAEKITGFKFTEMKGKKAGGKELWGGLMGKAFYQKLWRQVKIDKKVFAGELNNHRKDGQPYIAAASIAPILGRSGQVEYFVAVERDITHAKEVDRMKTEFISLASHQLRTPLSAMKWFLEMLMGGDAGKLNKQQAEFATNINLSNERMIDLVNSLLNISRIESGRIMIEPEPTNLCELIKEVVTELTVKIKEKDINLVLSCNDQLPSIKLDPKLIREVYKNLLSNAIKYSPQKTEVKVLVSIKDHEVVSQISDQGIGIPENQQDKVFQKFFRATNIVKVETDGTGLGLYLTKAIVESSQGKIWFESQENKGTSFWFTLPIKGAPKKKGEVSISS